MPDRITVSLSAVKVQNFAGSPRATMTGEAEFSDGERLRFRYRPAYENKPESVWLFTMRHGTGVTSTHRERVTMAAAREAFNARRAEESPLWAFVQRVASIRANSNSEPDTMGAALDEITGAAVALIRSAPPASVARGMTTEQARQLRPGDLVRVLIDGSGDVDDEERHYKAGAFAKVCEVRQLGAPQGRAVTFAIVSPQGAHVVNTFDEGDDGGRFALERLEPETLDYIRAQVFAYDLETLNEPTDGSEPKPPTGDDYNALFSLICG